MNESRLKKIVIATAAAGLVAWGACEVHVQRSLYAAPAVVEATAKGEDPADIARAAREMADGGHQFLGLP